MFAIIGIMSGGILCGFLLRKWKLKLKWVPDCITAAIWVLLFFLGIAVGNNKDILDNLDTIGWQALVISMGAILGSVTLAAVVYHVFFMKHEK